MKILIRFLSFLCILGAGTLVAQVALENQIYPKVPHATEVLLEAAQDFDRSADVAAMQAMLFPRNIYPEAYQFFKGREGAFRQAADVLYQRALSYQAKRLEYVRSKEDHHSQKVETPRQ